MNVELFLWPLGAFAFNRSPRKAQPGSKAILVLVDVS